MAPAPRKGDKVSRRRDGDGGGHQALGAGTVTHLRVRKLQKAESARAAGRLWAARIAVILITIASFWLTATRLSLSGDLTALFPDRGDAAALTTFTHAFGGGDVATILVRGESPTSAGRRGGGGDGPPRPSRASAAWRPACATRIVRSIRRSLGRPPTRLARERLAAALTPEGMKKRLDETRTMLLAPGSGSAEEWLARDPLRLAQIPWEARGELAAGFMPSDDGSFVADGCKARLIVVQPKGSAFNSIAA